MCIAVTVLHYTLQWVHSYVQYTMENTPLPIHIVSTLHCVLQWSTLHCNIAVEYTHIAILQWSTLTAIHIGVSTLHCNNAMQYTHSMYTCSEYTPLQYCNGVHSTAILQWSTLTMCIHSECSTLCTAVSVLLCVLQYTVTPIHIARSTLQCNIA